MAPGPKDNRGPCPGLNTLANHGYISRSGVSSVVELTTASNEGMDSLTYPKLNPNELIVFGMGLDLAAFLSAYSGVMAGDVNSVSIGGKPGSGILSGGLTSSLGLIEEPQGLTPLVDDFSYVTDLHQWRPGISELAAIRATYRNAHGTKWI